jgi:toxin ParE1/3/4
VSDGRYAIRPRADQDLDDQAYYYATVGSPEVGRRFLVAAQDTFALLSTPAPHGVDLPAQASRAQATASIPGEGFWKILILYLPQIDGVEILRVIHGSRNLQTLVLRQGLE